MSEDNAAELYALRCATEPDVAGNNARWLAYRERAEWFAAQLDAAIAAKARENGDEGEKEKDMARMEGR